MNGAGKDTGESKPPPNSLAPNPPEVPEHSLAGSLLTFGRLLKEYGFSVSPPTVMDALVAVSSIGVEDPNDFRDVLKGTFLSRREEIPIFDRLFEVFWLKGRQGDENEFDLSEKYAAEIDKLKTYYMKQHPKAVLKYCELVLQQSSYPASFPRDFVLDYNANTHILIVEYTLPSFEHLPTLNEVQYIVSRKEFKEYHISQAKQDALFDMTMYNITLRTLYELFDADIANALDAISFNGWVHSVDPATGTRFQGLSISLPHFCHILCVC